MMHNNFTRHAQRRMGERAISEFAIECLQRFGRENRSAGASRFEFDKSSRRRAAAWLGAPLFNRLEAEGAFDAFVVIDDSGLVITTGWRH